MMSCDEFGSRYLLEPESFPDWGAGEPFGTIALPMSVGGSHFTVSGVSARQASAIERLWPEFVGKPVARSTTLTIRRAPSPTFKKLDRWVYELDFDYGPTSLRIAGLDLMARVKLEPTFQGELWIATESPETFHGPFENFLRVVVAYAALGRGGALVHSAAVVEEDDAWLFVGHSGAGKSTVSRLGERSGRTVLSDDLNPVFPGAGESVEVVGSPFLGDLGARAPGRVALSGIYRLEQGTANAIRATTRAESLASLIACSPYVNFDPHRREALYRNLSSVATRLPLGVLTFQRRGDFWSLLERRALVQP